MFGRSVLLPMYVCTAWGSPGMTVGDLIAGSSIPGDRYDTAVDSLDATAVFCVFDRQQALPEFLIEFSVDPDDRA